MKTTGLLFIIVMIFFLQVATAAGRPISWEPEKLDLVQAAGTQSHHIIRLSSNEVLQDIKATIKSEVSGWFTVSPSSFAEISKDAPLEISLVINIPSDVVPGEYGGIVQLYRRQALRPHQTRNVAKPFPFELVVTEAVQNVELPPDPGDAGDQTLLGIDSDQDGVRDDIQRYIYFTYPDDELIRAALTQISLEYQGIVAHADDPDASYKHTVRMSRHGECLDYIQGVVAGDSISALKAEFLNTRDRTMAYLTYNSHLGGKIFIGKPFKEWKDSCNFDVDALGGN